MKNTFILLLLLTIRALSFGQTTNTAKDVNNQQRQIEIDKKEAKHFYEQVESLGTAVETGSEESIKAVKAMIKTSMEREIEQSKLRVAAKTAGTPPKNKAQMTRKEQGQNYVINKRAEEADVRQTDENTDLEERSTALLSYQTKIYKKYASISDTDTPNLRELLKLAVVFHDTLLDDLEHQSAQLETNTGGN